MNAPATIKETPAVRPLSVLVPLIKTDLSHGREAAEKAGLPYYRAAGEKMIEAKAQLQHGEFISWVERNFSIGRRHANQYMALARATAGLEMGVRTPGLDTLRDMVREHTSNKNYGKPASWQTDIRDNVARARQEAARLQEESLSRAQEREAEKRLALRLIDIGYKVLAKELHPDRGGTKDAMVRLGKVRTRLKGCA